MSVAILTVSDRAATGEYEDASGPALQKLVADRLPAATVVATDVVPDEKARIVAVVTAWCESSTADLVITTGGTGLAARDVTPEALESIIERPIPGLGEAMRTAGRRHTVMADLSRQVAGQRGKVLIIAVPGSPKAATQSIEAIAEVLPHAVELISS